MSVKFCAAAPSDSLRVGVTCQAEQVDAAIWWTAPVERLNTKPGEYAWLLGLQRYLTARNRLDSHGLCLEAMAKAG